MIRIVGRVFLWILAVGGIGFAIFQFYRAAHSEYDTLPAVEYRISDSIRQVKGIVIREEMVLPNTGGGELSYLYTDGAHVSAGMTVARKVTDKEDILRQMRRDELTEELEALQEVTQLSNIPLLQTDAISDRVYVDIDTIAVAAASGQFAPAQEVKSDILSQLNRRSIAVDGGKGFSQRISKLQSELASLGGSASAGSEVTAPQPGYFTKEADGLESVLTLENIQNYTVEDFIDKINMEMPEKPQAAGKLITSHVWYYAAAIQGSQIEKFREGSKVELDFGITGQDPLIGKVTKILTEEGGARSVVLFECSEMSEALSSLRVSKADISLDEMTGYQMPIESRRYQDNIIGVYVLDAGVIEFRPVEVLYENEKEGIIVYSQSYRDAKGKGLNRFDSVIVGGTGLEDGKVIEQ